jgi:con80 domain of Katanin
VNTLEQKTSNPSISSICCIPDNKQIIFGDSNGIISYFDMSMNQKLQNSFRGHSSKVTNLKYMSGILGSTGGQKARLWKWDTKPTCIAVSPPLKEDIFDIHLGLDDGHALSILTQKYLQIYSNPVIDDNNTGTQILSTTDSSKVLFSPNLTNTLVHSWSNENKLFGCSISSTTADNDNLQIWSLDVSTLYSSRRHVLVPVKSVSLLEEDDFLEKNMNINMKKGDEVVEIQSVVPPSLSSSLDSDKKTLTNVESELSLLKTINNGHSQLIQELMLQENILERATSLWEKDGIIETVSYLSSCLQKNEPGAVIIVSAFLQILLDSSMLLHVNSSVLTLSSATKLIILIKDLFTIQPQLPHEKLLPSIYILNQIFSVFSPTLPTIIFSIKAESKSNINLAAEDRLEKAIDLLNAFISLRSVLSVKTQELSGLPDILEVQSTIWSNEFDQWHLQNFK